MLNLLMPLYSHFVNTTLGDGEVTPVEPWRLLAPMTAINGVLLFGPGLFCARSGVDAPTLEQ
jgi:hypothetical protein